MVDGAYYANEVRGGEALITTGSKKQFKKGKSTYLVGTFEPVKYLIGGGGRGRGVPLTWDPHIDKKMHLP